MFFEYTGPREKVLKRVFDTVNHRLRDWNPRGPMALVDCNHFVIDRGDLVSDYPEAERGFELSDMLGLWVACNLFDSSPRDLGKEQTALMRPIGLLVTQSWHGWWE